MWHFGIIDAIDIFSVAALMYYLYRVTKSNGSFVIFQGIIAVFVAWLIVSQLVKMRLMGAILDGVISVGFIAIVVLFQNEIRQMLINIGSRHQWKPLLMFFGRTDLNKVEDKLWLDKLVYACRNMSESKTGALIVIQGTDDLSEYEKTGEEMDAVVSARLIEQVFYKNTPLHDGAMIITGNRIRSAACILPVSHNKRIPQELGLRHRSAMGLAEITDAKVVVVSEETGSITVAWRSKLYRELTPSALQKLLLKEKP